MHLRAASSAMPLGIAFTRCSIPAHALNACSSCLEAQVRIRPMTLANRIKKYGTFKTVVDMHDKLDIHYYFDGSLPQNTDLFDRPLTNM